MSFKQELLEYIKDFGELVPAPFESKYEHIKRLRRSTLYGTIYRLEKDGLIKRNKITQSKPKSYVLTIKGNQLVKQHAKLLRRTDGLSTIIIFDIPAAMSKQRTTFRRYLHKNGYTLLQESVLISPHKVHKELRDLAKELKINNFVKVLSARVDYI